MRTRLLVTAVTVLALGTFLTAPAQAQTSAHGTHQVCATCW